MAARAQMVFRSYLRWRFHDCAEAEGDQFDFTVGVNVAVAVMMFLLEVAEEVPEGRPIG